MIPSGGGEFRPQGHFWGRLCTLSDAGASVRGVTGRDREADHVNTSTYDVRSPTSISVPSFTGVSLYDAA